MTVVSESQWSRERCLAALRYTVCGRAAVAAIAAGERVALVESVVVLRDAGSFVAVHVVIGQVVSVRACRCWLLGGPFGPGWLVRGGEGRKGRYYLLGGGKTL